MPVARVPADLRSREDLTIGDIDRILDLRRARKKLDARIETLEADLKAARESSAASMAEERKLLAAD